jgi:membrane protein YqaA with SNARE-associated domain
MLRRLYDWTLSMTAKPGARWGLGGISFAESSFFPIPPDVMLIPMCLARPDRALQFAMITTLASVAGGVFGYLIGALLYESVGVWVIELYGLTEKAVVFREVFNEQGYWVILLAGFTPIPYKLITITAGFTGYDVVLFIVLSAIARGARFFLLAGLLYAFGESIRRLIDRHFALLTTAVGVAGIGGFAAVKLLF